MYKGLCHNYLKGGLGYQMGAKGKITTLPREKLPAQQVLLGEAQASFELFERTVELSCGK